MSTEKQEQSDKPGSKSTTDSQLIGEDTSKRDPTSKKAHQSSNKKRDLFNRLWHSYRIRRIVTDLRVWLEVLALVVLIAYTRYAGQQSKALNDTLTEIRAQTEYAKNSSQAARDAAKAATASIEESQKNRAASEIQSKAGLDASITASRTDQRAWVGLSGIQAIPDTLQVGKPQTFVIRFTNTGHSPARNSVGSVVLEPRLKGEKPIFGYSNRVERRGLIMPNGNNFTTVIVEPRDTHAVDMPPMTKGIVDEITSGDIVLYIHGVSFYEDIFRTTHWFTFCYALMKGTGPIQFEACPYHNDTGDGKKAE